MALFASPDRINSLLAVLVFLYDPADRFSAEAVEFCVVEGCFDRDDSMRRYVGLRRR